MTFKHKQTNDEHLIDLRLDKSQILIVENVKNFVLSTWKMDSIHGLPHWQNVARNGFMLGEHTKANPFVTQLFAYLHDSCRLNNGADLEHGVRAAELVLKLKDSLLKELSAKELEQLYLACKFHTTELRMDEATIDTCFDADRLDLVRLNIVLDPTRMATNAGIQFATPNS